MGDGISVLRYSSGEGWTYKGGAARYLNEHNGIWYPVDVARAREQVVEAARQLLDYIDLNEAPRAMGSKIYALRRALDAAEGGAG